MRKYIVRNGKRLRLFCECDEEWGGTTKPQSCVPNLEYKGRCPKCGMFPWTRHDYLEVKDENKN